MDAYILQVLVTMENNGAYSYSLQGALFNFGVCYLSAWCRCMVASFSCALGVHESRLVEHQCIRVRVAD